MVGQTPVFGGVKRGEFRTLRFEEWEVGPVESPDIARFDRKAKFRCEFEGGFPVFLPGGAACIAEMK